MRNKPIFKIIVILAILLFLGFIIVSSFQKASNSVKPKIKENRPPPKERIDAPAFSADSAYAYIQKQVDFGPRNPNSASARACGDWLESKLASFGAKVSTQEDIVIAYDGTELEMRNIIAEFHPEKTKRIMLYAHWDTRPFADKDTIRMDEPIDGANDGGSGVGVLLEIARVLEKTPTEYGIDIILFDSEDYGRPNNSPASEATEWCLGSQYWSRNPHKPNYRAKYGILLDMVGGKNASFPREGTSLEYAQNVVNKIWRSANSLGHSSLFNQKETNRTIDDHLFVNAIAGVPSAAIVEFHVHQMGGYGKFHHTHQDNMDNISPETLQAVGDVVMDVIYNE
ncbi:MAG: M28 family peptidase [Flavobacteriales bacterium]